MRDLLRPLWRTHDRRFFPILIVISLSIGLVNALSAAHDAARHGRPYTLGRPLVWEITSILIIILVSPIVLTGIRRLRTVQSWPLRVVIAAGSIGLFSCLHIAGMVGLRKLLMALVGGSYDFQTSLETLLYEFRKDALTALLIGGAAALYDSYRDALQMQPGAAAKPTDPPLAPTPPAEPAPQPAELWLRDGPQRIRIATADILSISSAGNYIEYELADGTRHLIRGTLAAAENQLSRVNIARIHRTRLANLDRVRSVSIRPSGDFDLTFDTGQTTQGSRRYRAAIEALDQTAAAT